MNVAYGYQESGKKGWNGGRQREGGRELQKKPERVIKGDRQLHSMAHTDISIYPYTYIYLCVCVCVCVRARARARAHMQKYIRN